MGHWHLLWTQSGMPINVGTVHTFQGKEAPVVFFVLGADKQSSGAAQWAVSEPNMMNVAATRAKKEFYKRVLFALFPDKRDLFALLDHVFCILRFGKNALRDRARGRRRSFISSATESCISASTAMWPMTRTGSSGNTKRTTRSLWRTQSTCGYAGESFASTERHSQTRIPVNELVSYESL